MSSMKRVRLAVLFLIAAAVLASGAAPVLGAGCKLTPNGDEPDASGAASLPKLKFLYLDGSGTEYYSGNLRVTCRDLTPGQPTRSTGTGARWGNSPPMPAATVRLRGRSGSARLATGDGKGSRVTVQRDGGTTVLGGHFYPSGR